MSWWKTLRFGLALASRLSVALSDNRISREEIVEIVTDVLRQFNFEIRF